MTCRAIAVLAIMLMPATIHAQTTGTGTAPAEPPPGVRMRLGPLYVNPTLALTNLGVDNNVFNQPDQEQPQSDFTITVTPAADLWLRFGRSWLSANIKEDLVYYQEFESERSANHHYRFNWLIPFNRLTLTPGASYVNTRERPGFEIDARSQRKEVAYTGTAEIRAMSKSFVGVRGARTDIDFEEDEFYQGVNLNTSLSRVVTVAGVTVRHELTPLTSLTFELLRQYDRFKYTPLRDSDSGMMSFGVRFDPLAIIKGSATFGYRNFEPKDVALPPYNGGTMAVDLSYVALGTTRFGFQATRDVQYSYEFEQPYYLQTGFTASVQQQLFGPMDVVGRIGRSRLAYRDRAGTSVANSDRTDYINIFGAGLGYRLGRDIRAGFNVDYQKRIAPPGYRPYDGLRYGVSVTYGAYSS